MIIIKISKKQKFIITHLFTTKIKTAFKKTHCGRRPNTICALSCVYPVQDVARVASTWQSWRWEVDCDPERCWGWIRQCLIRQIRTSGPTRGPRRKSEAWSTRRQDRGSARGRWPRERLRTVYVAIGHCRCLCRSLFQYACIKTSFFYREINFFFLNTAHRNNKKLNRI